MHEDFFKDFEAYQSRFLEKIRVMMSGFEDAVKEGKIKGGWTVNKIDKPGVKGFIVEGRFEGRQPLTPFDPFNPFEPINPRRRRPMPKRPFEVDKKLSDGLREPLTDVFEDEGLVKIFAEVPGEAKGDIMLNVTGSQLEIKGKTYYKLLSLPTSNIDLEKASSKYKNGVLEVVIPKKEISEDQPKRKISVD